MVHADHRRHHRQVLADARGLILLTGATGYIGSRLLRELEAGGCHRRLNETGVGVMTTAVLATYYPPRRRLTVSYAGHPTDWIFRADTGAWTPLCGPVPPPEKLGLIDLPMGIGFTPSYNRHRAVPFLAARPPDGSSGARCLPVGRYDRVRTAARPRRPAAGQPFMQRKLRRLFAYRHAVTRQAFE